MTTPPKKDALIGKGKNLSVRRLQLGGLSKPSGPGPAGNLSLSARPWKKLPHVDDWDAYKKTPTDIVLIKDLEQHSSSLEKLRHRLRDADDQDLEQLQHLCVKVVSDRSPLYARLKELVEDRRLQPMLEGALEPIVVWARDLMPGIGRPSDASAFCERFVDACKRDASALLVVLVDASFPADDYAHVLAFGRALDPHPTGAGLSPAQAFARGFAHAIAPRDVASAPTTLKSSLDARGLQGFVFGYVCGAGLEQASKDPLVPHTKNVIDLLTKKL